MAPGRPFRVLSPRLLIQGWPWLVLLLALVGIRLSKGAFLSELYALLSAPFWPGSAQKEWVTSAQQLSDQIQLAQLRLDNERLRTVLELNHANPRLVMAPVISREPGGWWQQLVIGRGELQGLHPGDAVVAPGGLVGRVASVTPVTARVTLLTDTSSQLGVWVGRTQRHGLLTGLGTARPVLRFLEKDPQVRPGDVVVTSPASTLVPPNLTVGVIQAVNDKAVPAPEALVQLSAPIEAVDGVQVMLTGRR
ncbi:rod shape-determining protein MreC [Cyanobium sp. Morenito 9A2]|uniref:rod shape-determining protein MreC n=1 Tax=Cyanobium sp. Morenito 9A2 TaxID=2823718 RepID=UPI0020CEDB86|nr:rod shape-determining protein MreC [Cyanobium sp. Morenito 9A2]MCP9849495.1 rod shape-determining protein MreC [Cyanobium sp. Morenito 9A2]